MYLYVIEDDYERQTKIGITYNVQRRLAEISICRSRDLRFRYCAGIEDEDDTRTIEKATQQTLMRHAVDGVYLDMFGDVRPKTEWFEVDWRVAILTIMGECGCRGVIYRSIYDIGEATPMKKEVYKNVASVHMISRARDLYLSHPQGLTDVGLSEMLSVSRMTAYRIRCELPVVETLTRGVYRYQPTFDEIATARKIIYLDSLVER